MAGISEGVSSASSAVSRAKNIGESTIKIAGATMSGISGLVSGNPKAVVDCIDIIKTESGKIGNEIKEVLSGIKSAGSSLSSKSDGTKREIKGISTGQSIVSKEENESVENLIKYYGYKDLTNGGYKNGAMPIIKDSAKKEIRYSNSDSSLSLVTKRIEVAKQKGIYSNSTYKDILAGKYDDYLFNGGKNPFETVKSSSSSTSSVSSSSSSSSSSSADTSTKTTTNYSAETLTQKYGSIANALSKGAISDKDVIKNSNNKIVGVSSKLRGLPDNTYNNITNKLLKSI